MWSMIGAVINAVNSVFNWMTGRGTANNTPEMVDRKKHQDGVNQDDQDATAIKNGDENAIKNGLS